MSSSNMSSCVDRPADQDVASNSRFHFVRLSSLRHVESTTSMSSNNQINRARRTTTDSSFASTAWYGCSTGSREEEAEPDDDCVPSPFSIGELPLGAVATRLPPGASAGEAGDSVSLKTSRIARNLQPAFNDSLASRQASACTNMIDKENKPSFKYDRQEHDRHSKREPLGEHLSSSTFDGDNAKPYSQVIQKRTSLGGHTPPSETPSEMASLQPPLQIPPQSPPQPPSLQPSASLPPAIHTGGDTTYSFNLGRPSDATAPKRRTCSMLSRESSGTAVSLYGTLLQRLAALSPSLRRLPYTAWDDVDAVSKALISDLSVVKTLDGAVHTKRGGTLLGAANGTSNTSNASDPTHQTALTPPDSALLTSVATESGQHPLFNTEPSCPNPAAGTLSSADGGKGAFETTPTAQVPSSEGREGPAGAGLDCAGPTTLSVGTAATVAAPSEAKTEAEAGAQTSVEKDLRRQLATLQDLILKLVVVLQRKTGHGEEQQQQRQQKQQKKEQPPQQPTAVSPLPTRPVAPMTPGFETPVSAATATCVLTAIAGVGDGSNLSIPPFSLLPGAAASWRLAGGRDVVRPVAPPAQNLESKLAMAADLAAASGSASLQIRPLPGHDCLAAAAPLQLGTAMDKGLAVAYREMDHQASPGLPVPPLGLSTDPKPHPRIDRHPGGHPSLSPAGQASGKWEAPESADGSTDALFGTIGTAAVRAAANSVAQDVRRSLWSLQEGGCRRVMFGDDPAFVTARQEYDKKWRASVKDDKTDRWIRRLLSPADKISWEKCPPSTPSPSTSASRPRPYPHLSNGHIHSIRKPCSWHVASPSRTTGTATVAVTLSAAAAPEAAVHAPQYSMPWSPGGRCTVANTNEGPYSDTSSGGATASGDGSAAFPATATAVANSSSGVDGGGGPVDTLRYGSLSPTRHRTQVQEQLVDETVVALAQHFMAYGSPLCLVKLGPFTYGLDHRRLRLKLLPDGRLAVRCGSGWEELTRALAKLPLPRGRSRAAAAWAARS